MSLYEKYGSGRTLRGDESLTARRSRPAWVVFALLAVMFLAGCGGAEIPKPPVERYWPVPPDPPRIAYAGAFSHPRDMGKKRSFFRAIFSVVFGKKQLPSMLRPFAITEDSRGKIYITDTGLQAVHIYDWSHKEYEQIFWIERGVSRLLSPAGVAVDDEENVYVSDSQLNRVFVYDSGQRLIRTIGTEGEFERLGGLAISPVDKLLYIVDAGGHRVVAVDREGKTVKTIGRRGSGDGEFNFPSHIAIDRNGWLYITDTMNFRVQVFDSDGKFVNEIGKLGGTLGSFSKPKGVAVDSEGHIYVVDGIYDAVQIFDREGRLLLRFGKTGEGPGDLWLPNGIFIDQDDRIYVADTYNRRVQAYRFLGSPAPEELEKQGLNN